MPKHTYCSTFTTAKATDSSRVNNVIFFGDTRTIWTHGKMFGAAASWGSESGGGISLTVGNTSKTISLSSHTHNYAAASHTHGSITQYETHRNNDSQVILPSALPAGLHVRFRNSTGASGSGFSWNTILSVNAYSGGSSSGAGYRHEFLFSDSNDHKSTGNFWIRHGVDSSWGSWIKVLTSGNSSLSGSTVKINDTSATFSLSSHNHSGVYAPASHSHSYLPLSGGTMTGAIVVSTPGILQDLSDASNYKVLCRWRRAGKFPYTSGMTYGREIGHYNVGDTDGSITLLPYETTVSPWGGEVGLYISKNTLKFNGASVSLSGHTHSQYLTSHQSISHLLKIDGTNGTAAGVSALINKLTTGTSTPVDTDYYISQSVNGGTTTTTYYRRPISALWTYINGKAASVYLKLSGGSLTGSLKTSNTNGVWIIGKTNAAIQFNGLSAIDSTSAWWFYNMKSASGHVIAFGGLGDNIGFYNFLSSRTSNGFDYSFVCNTATGVWNFSNCPTVAGSPVATTSDLEGIATLIDMINGAVV